MKPKVAVIGAGNPADEETTVVCIRLWDTQIYGLSMHFDIQHTA